MSWGEAAMSGNAGHQTSEHSYPPTGAIPQPFSHLKAKEASALHASTSWSLICAVRGRAEEATQAYSTLSPSSTLPLVGGCARATGATGSRGQRIGTQTLACVNAQ
eukprot:1138081-Rhodomonas_salina.1